MKTIPLTFKGYWPEAKKNQIAQFSGIYCVYRCAYNATTNKVYLIQLLYIGQADDIRDRLTNHEKLKDWKRHLEKGEELCYSRAQIEDEKLRLRAEAALIFYHKPCENTQHKDHFDYPETEIELSGDCKFLTTNFVVDD